AEELGDVEDLGVEPEALQLLPREYFLRRFPLKKFEAALRVMEWQTRYGAHHQVEEASGVFAERRLMDSHQRAIERPRPDRDLRAALLHRREQLFDLLDGGRQIGVGEQRP